jgi:thiamine-phosphate pyrophosphorylase
VKCQLYYITDRKAFSPDENIRRARLLEKIGEAARAGVDYIQLREKDLPIRDLESLAREAVRVVEQNGTGSTALLINSRTDVALATGAAGVHLPANDVSPKDVRNMYASALGVGVSPRISVSCHSPAEVNPAEEKGACAALFAPVFEKKDASGVAPQGLAALEEACRAKIPVLALGGITLENAAACLRAGATGIAAIRLFQENDVAAIARALRTNVNLIP